MSLFSPALFIKTTTAAATKIANSARTHARTHIGRRTCRSRSWWKERR